VSERFDYTKQPSLLVDFLWGLSHASCETLGMDPTVTKASDEEAEVARRHLQLSRDTTFYKVAVPSRENSERMEMYLIPSKVRSAMSPFERGTRSTIALRLRGCLMVFFKDYWREKVEGLLNEGEVYSRLEQAEVPHIAPFDHGNDLRDHESIGHIYEAKSCVCQTIRMALYQHYRMTLGVVDQT